MSEQQVRDRVAAFGADYERAWQRAGIPPQHGAPTDFDAWRAALAEVAAAHFVPGVPTGQEGSMSSRCAHTPEETVDTVVVDQVAGTAEVTSTAPRGPLPDYYTYTLARSGDGTWLIAALEAFRDPPGTPLVDQAEAARLLDQATYDAPLGPLPADERRDPGALFGTGATVVAVGEMTTEGIVSVRDYGYGDASLEPLARRVPPGTYAAEVAVADGVNAALRLVLSDAPTTAWHPAARASGNAVVGVDAGNVAICDLAGLVACGAQDVERHFDRHALTLPSSGAAAVFAQRPGGPADVVMVTSGYGDGGYPAYWGSAGDGTLTQLVVDFMVVGD